MSGSGGDTDTLEILLNKATNPSNEQDDWDLILKFCDKVNFELDGIQTCTRLLVHKMQSPQEREALQALMVLEGCVKNCGANFHKELGKYRFLNELIKLVSPKYLGSQTTQKVKDKVIGMLYTWSIALSEQIKIRDAYQMLKKQGIVKIDPPFNQSLISNPPPPRPDNDTLFTDKEKRVQLDKLLKSNKPEDLQAANRLIKSVVKEDEEKMEKLKKRTATLEEVNNNVKLLNEMLLQFKPDSPMLGDMQAMKEIYDSCQKLRPTLFRLASDTNDDEQALMEILRANDEVTKAMQQFEKLVQPKLRMTINGNMEGTSEPLKTESKPEDSSALLELSGLSLNTPTNVNKHFNGDTYSAFTTDSKPSSDDFDDGLLSFQSAPVVSSQEKTSNLFDGLLMPQPTSTTSTTMSQKFPNNQTTNQSGDFSDHAKPSSFFADIDVLSQALMEKSLGGKMGTSFPETVPKLSLNELTAKTQDSVPPSAFGDPFDSFNFSSLEKESTSSSNVIETQQSSQPFSLPVVPPISEPNLTIDSSPTQDFSLNNIFVPLEAIRPSTFPPLTAYDNNGIRIMLHFAKDHASSDRTDTLVSVVSIMSTRTNPVHNVVFQAAAPKVMKVKLQPPSSTELPAYNPIFSTPPLTQVMILANPNKKDAKIRYKLDYSIDQQTSISENGLISGFPPVDQWGKL